MTAHKRRQLKSVLSISILALLLVLAAFAAVKLFYPANNSFTNGSNNSIRFIFLYNASVGNRTTCNLIINSVSYGFNKTGPLSVNKTGTNRNATIRANHTITEGLKHWNITCTNSSNTAKSVSKLFNFTIDRTRPTITLNYPPNGYNTTNTRLDLNFTASDNLAKTFKCNVTLASVINRSVAVTNNSLNNVTITFGSASKSWKVTCKDNTTTNNRISSTRTFTIDAVKPLVVDVRPRSGHLFNVTFNKTNKVEIAANVTDALTGVSSVTANITRPGPIVVTLTLSQVGVTAKYNSSYTLKNFSGRYNVSFRAVDVAGNVNKTVTTFFKVNDSIAPSITGVASSGISSSVATVTWTTDEQANGTVEFSTTKSYGGSTSSTTPSTSHSIGLSGLNSGALYYFNITSCDVSGNCKVSGGYNFTTTAAGSGGGGGGGGSIFTTPSVTTPETITVESATTIQSVAKVWDSIDSSTPAMFTVDATKVPVTQVLFTVNKKIYGSSIKVNLLSGKPSDTSDVPGKVSAYLEIIKGALSNSDIITATVGFKVAKSWLSSNSLSQTDVNMYRFVGTDWQKLSTSVAREDSDYVYYSSTTPGFSFFAIGGSPQPVTPVVKAPVAAPAPVAPAKSTPTPTPVKPANNNNLLWGIAGLVVIALLYSTFFKKKNKHSKFY